MSTDHPIIQIPLGREVYRAEPDAGLRVTPIGPNQWALGPAAKPSPAKWWSLLARRRFHGKSPVFWLSSFLVIFVMGLGIYLGMSHHQLTRERESALAALADTRRSSQEADPSVVALAVEPFNAASAAPHKSAKTLPTDLPVPSELLQQLPREVPRPDTPTLQLQPIGPDGPGQSARGLPTQRDTKRTAKSTAVEPEPMSSVVLDEAPDRSHTPAPRLGAASPSSSMRLVAIKDGHTILVPNERGVPVPVQVGQQLPNGAVLRSVDPNAGTAVTSTGQLRLE